jgi:hypothetical protein
MAKSASKHVFTLQGAGGELGALWEPSTVALGILALVLAGDNPVRRPHLLRVSMTNRATQRQLPTLGRYLLSGDSARVLGVALGLLTAAHERTAVATNYTITVDASRQTAGNPRFWSASVGTGTASLTLRPDLQTHYKLLNRELGMQRVRGHGVLNDDIGIYKGGGTYDFTNFDTYLNAIVSAGMRPIMELDFMPTALALNDSSRDYPRTWISATPASTPFNCEWRRRATPRSSCMRTRKPARWSGHAR